MPDHKTLEELRDQLLLNDVLDNIDAGIIIYDADGNFVYMNPVMVNWRNIPRSEYLTMNVRDFYDVLDVCVFDLVCQQKRRVSRLQYYHQRGQGSSSPARVRIVTGTPLFDSEGNIQYVVVILQDVDNFERQYRRLRDQNEILTSDHDRGRRPEQEITMVARSPEILQLLNVTDNLAQLDSTVLLTGESGTGKEVFARYIHERSARKDKPLITVNCAAIPENLLEAELFGYKKGSFTGADREGKIGLCEAADGGTLFLDEINSLPLSLQGKVLRMIEEKSVQPIGALKAKKVDFRLITATNRNLLSLVKKGEFREDLYYRLNVIPLAIPPVRGRRDDIIPLCLHFLHEFCQKYNLQKSFSEDVLARLKRYDWPGNVREIRNFVERMVVMTPASTREISSIPDGLLSPDNDVLSGAGTNASAADADRPYSTPGGSAFGGAAFGGSAPGGSAFGDASFDGPAFGPRKSGSQPAGYPIVPPARRPLTKEDIQAALKQAGGRRETAAALLGISRRQLQYRIKEFHLSERCRYGENQL